MCQFWPVWAILGHFWPLKAPLGDHTEFSQPQEAHYKMCFIKCHVLRNFQKNSTIQKKVMSRKGSFLPILGHFCPFLTLFWALGQHPEFSRKKALDKICPLWVSTPMQNFRKIERSDFKIFPDGRTEGRTDVQGRFLRSPSMKSGDQLSHSMLRIPRCNFLENFRSFEQKNVKLFT